VRARRDHAAAIAAAGSALTAANQRFYDGLWRDSHLVAPERFNTWPIVQPLVALGGERLELAPGLRPRLPMADTHFVDISAAALGPLRDRGGRVALAAATAMPFPAASFHLLAAFDIIEHLDDDDAGFAELARLAVPGGRLLLSVPLHMSRWSRFDDIVGHCRRYDPRQLVAKLRRHGFAAERSAAFGMRPRWSWLASLGMDLLARHPRRGCWCYNKILLPWAIMRQHPLRLTEGVVAAADIDDLLLLCRRV
jgi:SAM-dependent methyltransferase